jgi:hypothetical protein
MPSPDSIGLSILWHPLRRSAKMCDCLKCDHAIFQRAGDGLLRGAGAAARPSPTAWARIVQALKRQFDLNDDFIEDLNDEFLHSRQAQTKRRQSSGAPLR